MNKLDLEVSIWKESSKTALPSPTTWKIQCLCHIVIPRAWYTLIFSETGKNVKRLLLCAGWRSFTRVIKKSRCYFFKHIPLFKILFVKSLKLMWTEVCKQSWGPRLLQWLCLSGWMWSKDCFACSLKAQNYHESCLWWVYMSDHNCWYQSIHNAPGGVFVRLLACCLVVYS